MHWSKLNPIDGACCPRLCCVWLLWVALAVNLPGSWARADDVPGQLWTGTWRISTWGYESEGTIAWISSGPNIRFEILERVGPGTLDSLWRQEGDGWTLIAGGDGQGTINKWGREWRALDELSGNFLLQVSRRIPELYQRLGRVTSFPKHTWGSLARPPVLILPRAKVPERFLVESSFVLDVGTPSGAPATILRNLVRRGYGQGGPGEIVTLKVAWDGGKNLKQPLTVSSSRRPGRIRIVPSVLGSEFENVPLELFAPLWPLGEFLKLPHKSWELP